MEKLLERIAAALERIADALEAGTDSVDLLSGELAGKGLGG